MLAHIDRPGKEIPIVFLHGSGFSKDVFNHQMESEILGKHRLIALDLPGHGDSLNAEAPEQTYSYGGFAKSVLEFIKTKKLDKCIVAGWSLGGHAAMDMIDQSERVAGIMTFGSPPAPNGPIGLIRAMHFCRILLLAGKGKHSPKEIEYFERMCLNGQGAGKFQSVLERVDPLMRPNVSKNIMQNKETSQKQRVEQSNTPLCLLHGADDILVRLSYMRSIQSPALFRGETQVFEQCGHAPFMEQPESFDRLLTDFSQAVVNNEFQLETPPLALTA